MGIYIVPGHKLARDGGSFQEVQMNTDTHQILQMFGRYCTIRITNKLHLPASQAVTGIKFIEPLTTPNDWLRAQAPQV